MGDWRKVYNEKLNDLFPSPNIICMKKSSILRWAGHVEGRTEMHTVFGWGNLKKEATWNV